MREMKTVHVYHRFAWNEKIWINLKVELEAARNYTFVIASWKSAWKIRTDPLYKKSLSNNLIPNSHPISNHHHPTIFSKIQNSHFHYFYSNPFLLFLLLPVSNNAPTLFDHPSRGRSWSSTSIGHGGSLDNARRIAMGRIHGWFGTLSSGWIRGKRD